MAKILVLPSEVVDKAESGNSYAFPADNVIMSDKATSVEEAINNKPGEKIPGAEEDSVGGEIFNDYTNNIASGVGSHAEGAYTTASGAGSHAEGAVTIASGAYSHAEGYGTTASGNSSHAEGSYTIAASECQHVQGQYNVEDADGVYAHIVGWGSMPTSRKNIHTITTTGDGWFAGKVSAGTVETPSEPTEANDLITKKYFDENSGSGVGQLYPNEVDEETNPVGAPGEIFNVYEDSEELPGIKKNIASGAYSHAEGAATTASGTASHVEGATTTASGMSSHAEGLQTTASGDDSHAEGLQTTASGDGSHAEGMTTTASGKYSHAEGYGTTASGEYSHAEGIQTTASVLGSHAEGANTTASGDYQHVQGKWNIEDTESKYAHIVGWGTSSTYRANIHTITTSGDGWFAGKVSAGTVDSPAEPTENNDLITKKYFDENIVKDYTELDNIPTMNSIPISGDKSAVDYGLKPKDFEVTITGNSDSGYTSNKTFDEIEEAHNSGATVIARISNGPDIGYLMYKSLTNTGSIKRVNFIQVSGLTRYSIVIDGVSNTVTVDITELIPTESKIGGVKANQATDEDIIPARIGEDNKLYVSAKPLELVVNITGEEGALTSDTSSTDIISAIENNKDVYALYEGYKYEYISSTSTSVTFEREFGLHKISIKIDGTTVTHTDTEYKVSGSSSSGVGQLYPNDIDESTNPIGAPGEIFNTYEDDEDNGILKNIASGAYSHAEGISTTASGMASHSENYQTTASGYMSHAEGQTTTASGMCSHAEGISTTASSSAQHVQGRYNVEDTSNKYAHIVGGGSSDRNKKNIHTIDWNGNAYFEGKVSIGEANVVPSEPTDLVSFGYFTEVLNRQMITNVRLVSLEIGPTQANTFNNIQKLPDGYTVSNTIILAVLDITGKASYFGSSSYDFIIRLSEDGYIQLRFINNAQTIGRQFYLIIANINVGDSVYNLLNGNE